MVLSGPAPPAAAAPYLSGPSSWDHAALFNTTSSQHGLPNTGAEWFLNSGASTHVTGNSGNLSSSRSLPKHCHSSITVGNGAHLRIVATGSTTLSPSHLSLHDVAVCPGIVQNLISVCKLSTDNNVSIEFNPHGFNVKDFPTRRLIMTSSSPDPLYPFHGNPTTSGTAFHTTSGDLWHRQLGHPGKASLVSLSMTLLPDCNNARSSSCTASQLGRQQGLSFPSSNNVTSAYSL